jgi:hypothetical protein
MSNLNNDEIAMSVIIFASAVYVLSLSNIKLPCSIKTLFNNTIFKMVFLSLILVYTFERTPHIALIIAVIFILTLDYLNNEKMYENCNYLKSYMEQSVKENTINKEIVNVEQEMEEKE